MKVVFLSNYFNHHQQPFSEAMYDLLGDDYVFIETTSIPKARVMLGYGAGIKPIYVKQNFINEADKKQCQAVIDQADVVIYGSVPYSLLTKRLNEGKLTIKYSERIYKMGCPIHKLPWHFILNSKKYRRYKNLYLLCASAFTAADFAKTFTFINKTYKWGYFPKTHRYDSVDTLMQQKKPTFILWVARFLELKHPEHVIEVARRLKAENFDFQIQMVGMGPLWDTIAQQIKEYDLQDQVQLVGAVPADEVRKYMDDASIFLFASDRNEGWGAVLNEAMNSGCAVVASNAIGAVPFLIKDGENGLCYKSCDVDDLYNKVKYLLEHAEYRNTIGRKAYETIITLWNAETAAQRLIHLCEKLLQGEKHPYLYEDGPCSKALKIKGN